MLQLLCSDTALAVQRRREAFLQVATSQYKYRKEEEDADDGHYQAADGARCQREPESLLVRAHHEGDEAQDGGDHREEDGNDL